MREEFLFGEPEELDWYHGVQVSIEMVKVIGPSPVPIASELFGEPPSDAEIEAVMKSAKQISTTEGTKAGIYILQRSKDVRLGREKVHPIALYCNGELEEYCRPPWRVGAQLK